MSFKAMAVHAGLDRERLRDAVTRTIPIMAHAYEDKLKTPSFADVVAASKTFAAAFPNFLTVVIPDGTSVVLGCPLQAGKLFFTKYKGHHSMRYFIVTDAAGRIVFVSGMYPGSVSDAAMWEATAVNNVFDKAWRADILNVQRTASSSSSRVAVGGDKGYPSIKVSNDIFAVLVTESAAKTDAANEGEKKRPNVEYSATFAPLRAVVERTIRRIKLFERLGGSANYASQGKLLEHSVRFVCGYINDDIDAGRLSLVKPANGPPPPLEYE
jgi:hypothetical protein